MSVEVENSIHRYIFAEPSEVFSKEVLNRQSSIFTGHC